MKKPKPKIIKRLDWEECTKWVDYKLGYNTRDTLGKFETPGHEDYEYRDFWHLVIDICDVHNGCEIYLFRDCFENLKPWQGLKSWNAT